MQAKMSDDSDNQGFISGRIQIHSTQNNNKHQIKAANQLIQFQARYIIGQGIIKKEPEESFQINQDILIKRQQIETDKIQKDIKQQQGLTKQNLYSDTTKFALIYSRNKCSFQNKNKLIFQNQINLNYCQNQNNKNYRKVREFNLNIPIDNDNEGEILFDSCFQGGNLLYAYRSLIQSNTFYLFMQNDTNTYGYNQWFYFSMRNIKANVAYKFKIVNFVLHIITQKKRYSFFEIGFKPAIFSLMQAQQTKNGWYRDGSMIKYYQSSFIEEDVCYYTLQFVLKFDYQNDFIMICPFMPYSYSKLINCIRQMKQLVLRSELFCKVQSIGKSLAYNQIPYISLTKTQDNIDKKPNIVIIARQHSGQTWSSFLVQSILHHLTASSNQINSYLLDNYVIRVFPMINVDGVIYGNFRCDLAGYDLNRSWKYPIPIIHDHISAIKSELERLKKSSGIELCLDLHTHSRQLGAFAYCCSDSEKGKELPLIFSKISPIFRYKACTFGISSDKKSTVRALVYNLTKNYNAITIELSAFGFKMKNHNSPIQFSPRYIKNIAYTILYGYYCYVKSLKPIYQPLHSNNHQLSSIQVNPGQDYEEDNPVQGSDSQPDQDEIELNVKIQKIFPKKISQIIIQNEKKYYSYNLNLLEKPIKKLKIEVNPPQKRFLKSKSIMKKQLWQNIQSFTQLNDANDKKSIPIQNKTTNLLLNSKRKSAYLQNGKKYKSYEKSKEVKSKIDANSNKILRLKSTLPLNSIEFSLSQLARHKQIQNVNDKIQIQEDYFPFVGVKSYAKNNQLQTQKNLSTQIKQKPKPKIRSYIKRHQLMKQQQRLQQQLPHLVVISEKKKQKYYAKFKCQKNQSNINRNLKEYLLNGTKFNKFNCEKSFYARKQSLIIFKEDEARLKYKQQIFKNKI